MRILVVGISLLVLIGCTKQDEDFARNENLVLTATLKVGEPPSDIRFFSMTESGEQIPIEGLTVRLDDQRGTSVVLEEKNGVYFSDDIAVLADRNYELRTSIDGRAVEASCHTPPLIFPLTISDEFIVIDPESAGNPVTTLIWTELDKEQFSYVLKLENLEGENKTKIPFQVPSGNFDRIYGTPFLNNQITLYDTDFSYYGKHRLTVYAVERALDEVYFYNSSDIRGLLRQGPDNVTGASGFFTGSYSFSINLRIQ